MTVVLRVSGLSKTFTLHTQGGAEIRVLQNVALDIRAGECVCLHGPSGAGKSTLLRSLYANCKPDAGQVVVQHDGASVDLASAEPWTVIEIRRRTIGHVSQFLRIIPRVTTLDVVAEPAIALGVPAAEAHARAKARLARLAIPERLWSLAPATFSGGEQQRVNIARGFVVDYPILLLDEPTASLDAINRKTVVALIHEAKARGAAIVGIFHDEEVRNAVADRLFEVGMTGAIERPLMEAASGAA
ncbi:phosphonate C-P lyase system protein PhnL [Labrys wisconsinensis]|uniref:Alpha-D-ribose 1-methylphosphonate 5-triphosphate synthase subunit PhnL n=1 Tax=Labrys wisconsinensis TaxID=425677 RepID=A0ABU0JG82_9HYPH|nr:phosphonate C-P lyase system protein PhnL [Labrys wisconsinensis]MDQ0473305.1 alpha-D-ribose 1-methylphosphonate 5-triphosphate synthase subunit PhnL [Labrys wisconsinensis]